MSFNIDCLCSGVLYCLISAWFDFIMSGLCKYNLFLCFCRPISLLKFCEVSVFSCCIMASSLDMSLDDRIKNRSNRGGRGRGGRGRAQPGRGPSGALNGGRMAGAVNSRRMTGAGNGGRTSGAVRRGPLMVNTRPSSYAIAKASSKSWMLIHVLENLIC